MSTKRLELALQGKTKKQGGLNVDGLLREYVRRYGTSEKMKRADLVAALREGKEGKEGKKKKKKKKKEEGKPKSARTPVMTRVLTDSDEKEQVWARIMELMKHCFPKLKMDSESLKEDDWLVSVRGKTITGAVLVDGNEIWSLCAGESGQGIGSALLRAAEAYIQTLRSPKYKKFVLFVSNDNDTDLVGYYSKRGYTHVFKGKNSKKFIRMEKKI